MRVDEPVANVAVVVLDCGPVGIARELVQLMTTIAS